MQNFFPFFKTKVMKKILPVIFLFLSQFVFAGSWTQEQIKLANTAGHIEYLTQAEKTTIFYINLARLYPKEFVEYELKNYYGTIRHGNFLIGSEYRESLIETLLIMEPVHALAFDQEMYESAKCFAIESGELGLVSHTRVNCEKKHTAECCSYGMETGKDIAMQWLVNDEGECLGHRKTCLSSALTKIGVGVAPHINYDFCAVANFKR